MLSRALQACSWMANKVNNDSRACRPADVRNIRELYGRARIIWSPGSGAGIELQLELEPWIWIGPGARDPYLSALVWVP